MLRSVIHHAYKAVYVMPWPPTAHDIPLPDLTDRFATLIPTSSSIDDRHQILFISQVFCRETTAGLWMLPKHILWYMTICNLHRGCQLKTILNHMGHCYVWIWNCTKDCTGG